MKHLLEVTHLQKQLGDFCLQDITFSLEPGYITWLIGRNGCGKTSLIKTILNLYEKDSGQIFVNGHSMESEEIAAKDQLGVVLDECLFDADIKAETNARCFGALYSRYDHNLFLEFCRRFNVDPQKKIGKLSTGSDRRLHSADGAGKAGTGSDPRRTFRTLPAFTWHKKTVGKTGLPDGHLQSIVFRPKQCHS